MLVKEQFMEILILHRQGFSNRQIAKRTGLSRNTVKKYLQDQETPPIYKSRKQRVTKLDQYHDYLQQRAKAASPEWIPASVLFREIIERGYSGGITQLREYLSKLKSMIKKDDPVVRFETEPGEQMQVDWAEFKFGKIKLHAFVATLGYSRHTYVEFVDDEKIETLLSCHQNAFEFFDGVPKIILYDNMKTVITKRNAYGEGLHKFQKQLWDYAKHCGFLPRLCKPYRAKTKGKVERFIGYLRRSFFNPMVATFKQGELNLDRNAANTAVLDWLISVANVRTHGTTGKKPLEIWLEIEKPLLQRLPPLYSGLRSKSKQKDVYKPCEATTLPGYENHSLQHPMAIYEHIEQLAIRGII